MKQRGGPEGIRTPCLFYAIEALYQLSYWPGFGNYQYTTATLGYDSTTDYRLVRG